jgi:CBS-domain-containing membrane protein
MDGYKPHRPPIRTEGAIVKTARDIMSTNVECASVNDTLVDAARKMRDLDVGALPICGDDNKLKGMLTDRDITVEPSPRAGTPAASRSPSSPTRSRSRSVPTTPSRRRCAR